MFHRPPRDPDQTEQDRSANHLLAQDASSKDVGQSFQPRRRKQQNVVVGVSGGVGNNAETRDGGPEGRQDVFRHRHVVSTSRRCPRNVATLQPSCRRTKSTR